MNNIEKIQLSLHINYVSDWDTKYAIREIIQNIKDSQSEQIINIDKGILYLGNKEGKLGRNTLLLGNSSKHDNTTIGKYGEGYKLALLVLLRRGIKTTIFNNDEIWTPSFEEHEVLGEEVLTISIMKNPIPIEGILFKIEDIDEGYTISEMLNSVLLTDEKYTLVSEGKRISIYRNIEEEDKGKIFVNGMYITQISGFEYCYDFKPNHLELGRDRNIVDEFEVCYATSEMWSEVKDKILILDMIKNNSPEIKFIDSWKYRISNEVLDTLALEYENYIPISYNEEITSYTKTYDTKSYTFKVVPSYIKNLVPKKKLNKKPVINNKVFYDKYKKQFTKRMLEDWKKFNKNVR